MVQLAVLLQWLVGNARRTALRRDLKGRDSGACNAPSRALHNACAVSICESTASNHSPGCQGKWLRPLTTTTLDPVRGPCASSWARWEGCNASRARAGCVAAAHPQDDAAGSHPLSAVAMATPPSPLCGASSRVARRRASHERQYFCRLRDTPNPALKSGWATGPGKPCPGARRPPALRRFPAQDAAEPSPRWRGCRCSDAFMILGRAGARPIAAGRRPPPGDGAPPRSTRPVDSGDADGVLGCGFAGARSAQARRLSQGCPLRAHVPRHVRLRLHQREKARSLTAGVATRGGPRRHCGPATKVDCACACRGLDEGHVPAVVRRSGQVSERRAERGRLHGASLGSHTRG
eukprot:scaffold2455_cov387-Prasinococcus_capsulatus_cf.AAC.5